jgi:heme/copper-type cytochrome/quinol oxidase subunit 4
MKMNLRQIRWSVIYYIHLGKNKEQRRALVNTIVKLWVP